MKPEHAQLSPRAKVAQATDESGAIAADMNRRLWRELPAETRAALLQAGISHPGETASETRCRLKRALDLLDDDDLAALLDCTHDSLARYRVDGVGPTPVWVARQIFYTRPDVEAWIASHRHTDFIEKARRKARAAH